MVESSIRIGGAVVFWTISEWTARVTLKEGLEAAGFGRYAPEQRLPAGALKDALEQVLGGPATLIRPLKTRDGFTVVTEDRGENGNAYHNSLVARVDGETLQITFTPLDTRATTIVGAFNEHLGLLRAAQVGSALVAILDAMGATRLRPGGALYWLSAYRLDEWQEVVRAVEASGVGRPHCVYTLRHPMDADAIRAVRDAIVAEVSTEAVRIDREVMNDGLGARGLETRRAQAEDLRRKIAEYEELLGGGLESLHVAVDRAEQAACKAMILASASVSTEVARAS